MYSVTHSCFEWIFWFNRKWNCSAQLSHERFRVTPDLKGYMKGGMKGDSFGPNAMPGGSGQMRHLASLLLIVYGKYLKLCTEIVESNFSVCSNWDWCIVHLWLLHKFPENVFVSDTGIELLANSAGDDISNGTCHVYSDSDRSSVHP